MLCWQGAADRPVAMIFHRSSVPIGVSAYYAVRIGRRVTPAVGPLGKGPLEEWYSDIQGDDRRTEPHRDGLLHVASLSIESPDDQFQDIAYCIDLHGRFARGAAIRISPWHDEHLTMQELALHPEPAKNHWRALAPSFAAWLETVGTTSGERLEDVGSRHGERSQLLTSLLSCTYMPPAASEPAVVMSDTQHIFSPNKQYYFLLRSYEVRMSHWITSASLREATSERTLLLLGNAWWSTDHIVWQAVASVETGAREALS